MLDHLLFAFGMDGLPYPVGYQGMGEWEVLQDDDGGVLAWFCDASGRGRGAHRRHPMSESWLSGGCPGGCVASEGLVLNQLGSWARSRDRRYFKFLVFCALAVWHRQDHVWTTACWGRECGRRGSAGVPLV